MLAPPKPSHDDAELLIKEARERQQRRRLLGAAGVAIAAGLTLGIHAVVNVDREHPRVHSSRGPRAVAAPCSAAAGWGLRLDGTWSEPTEQETAPLEVTRVGTPAHSAATRTSSCSARAVTGSTSGTATAET